MFQQVPDWHLEQQVRELTAKVITLVKLYRAEADPSTWLPGAIAGPYPIGSHLTVYVNQLLCILHRDYTCKLLPEPNMELI